MRGIISTMAALLILLFGVTTQVHNVQQSKSYEVSNIEPDPF